jgi:hypothetical protein
VLRRRTAGLVAHRRLVNVASGHAKALRAAQPERTAYGTMTLDDGNPT